LPSWFQRRDDQVIVQVGCGTPLLRIGLDSLAEGPDGSRAREIERSASNWSVLVSSSRYSSAILRRAFRYRGEIAETGFPRNDLLVTSRAQEAAAEVRTRLGIAPDKRVVLYAPTLRDDAKDPERRHVRVRNDLARAMAEFGADHILLIRNHPAA